MKIQAPTADGDAEFSGPPPRHALAFRTLPTGRNRPARRGRGPVLDGRPDRGVRWCAPPSTASTVRGGSVDGTEQRGRSSPMAELDTKDRKRIRSSDFAYVDKDGEGHLPIEDDAHIRNAMSRWNQTDFESKAAKERARKKILAAAKRAGIEVDEDDKIAHPVS